jgi:hypothetical protein
MDDYHEFRRAHAIEIEEWRQHWSPNCVSITRGGVSSSGTVSAGSSTSTSVGSGVGAGPSTSGTSVGVPPSFNPVEEFFSTLRKNYQGVRTEKLKSLQDFERKSGESLREAYARMRRLMATTHGVTEPQAIQVWYGILDKELRRRVRDATLLNAGTPTLVQVFTLAERIELNMVEEKWSRADSGGIRPILVETNLTLRREEVPM